MWVNDAKAQIERRVAALLVRDDVQLDSMMAEGESGTQDSYEAAGKQV